MSTVSEAAYKAISEYDQHVTGTGLQYLKQVKILRTRSISKSKALGYQGEDGISIKEMYTKLERV